MAKFTLTTKSPRVSRRKKPKKQKKQITSRHGAPRPKRDGARCTAPGSENAVAAVWRIRIALEELEVLAKCYSLEGSASLCMLRRQMERALEDLEWCIPRGRTGPLRNSGSVKTQAGR